jgi:hypothetical protein
LSWKVAVYPMRYEPLATLEKHKYVAPAWTQRELEAVAEARRVMGFGGALPPYKPLVEKFQRADSFAQAFELRPMRRVWAVPQPIVEMALEHQQANFIGTVRKRWGRNRDWRTVAV